MRRYFWCDVARGAGGRHPDRHAAGGCARRCWRRSRRCAGGPGEKHYVFMMGKLNAAKLASRRQRRVRAARLGRARPLDAKDFYRPVLTPYELLLALRSGEWTGEYVLDHARVLGRLRDDAVDAAAADGGGGGGSDDEDAPPTSRSSPAIHRPPRFDPRSLHERGRPTTPRRRAARSPPPPTARVLPGERGLVASQARSGAEFLATRGYRGLWCARARTRPPSSSRAARASQRVQRRGRSRRFTEILSVMETPPHNAHFFLYKILFSESKSPAPQGDQRNPVHQRRDVPRADEVASPTTWFADR